MSIITNLETSEITKKTVAELFSTTRTAYDNLLGSWQHGMDLIWSSESPADILSEMGTNAAGIVAAHTATVTFLESFSEGVTADRMVKVLPYTVHDDGTVTLN